MYKPVTAARMMLAKATRRDMFAHGCLSVPMNTPAEHAPLHLHLTV